VDELLVGIDARDLKLIKFQWTTMQRVKPYIQWSNNSWRLMESLHLLQSYRQLLPAT